jgi:hypothetical protein
MLINLNNGFHGFPKLLLVSMSSFREIRCLFVLQGHKLTLKSCFCLYRADNTTTSLPSPKGDALGCLLSGLSGRY